MPGRRKVASGDVVVVRYADDLVVGFQHRTDAERFLKEFRERLAKFGLELNPDKTRLIEFGRFAAAAPPIRSRFEAVRMIIAPTAWRAPRGAQIPLLEGIPKSIVGPATRPACLERRVCGQLSRPRLTAAAALP